MEKIREAVEILNNETTRIQILSNFADSQYCGSALRVLLSLAQSYLDIKGFPEEIFPEKRIATTLCEISFNKGRVVGFNDALRVCKLAHLKDKPKKIGRDEILMTMKLLKRGQEGALGSQSMPKPYLTDEEIADAILKLLEKEE